ncbi:MAG: adenylate/guanylate cyclase domain-containing protein [Cytophagaceae bacterium]|nr:MAG: adenylate/guanylate cyclase domain-containing protein [Cytophagaceae bacterium]
MPSFNQLTSMNHRASIRERIYSTAEKIASRDALRAGRVIPDTTDLALHEGRFLYAAVLFLDISKFTSRAQETQAQQEIMLQSLALFFTEMIRIVEEFGGVVEKNTGDGLMAYFVSSADETATREQRAVASALTMFYAANSAIDVLMKTRNIDPFEFRVCIDSGNITVAKLGAAQRFNGIVAIGTTANLACKMLNVAKAGELMIGNNVLRALPNDWYHLAHQSDYETGYVYAQTNAGYKYWYFTGRWTT